MKAKYATLFLISTICLSACGRTTPLSPTETSTPVFTSPKTETPRPTSAYGLTQTAFGTLMDNVCPTATPYPPQNGEANNISDAGILREFAGNYYRGTGFWVYYLIVNCDGTFHKVTYTDTGGQFITQGSLEVQNGEFVFQSLSDNKIHTFVYIPVRWGQRKYLLEEDYDDIETFCKAIATEDDYYQEPRNEESFIALVYLRIGDEKIEVTGLPVLPNGEEICK